MIGTSIYLKALFVAHLLQYVGDTPYIWGGDNPLEGMDCSGFAQIALEPWGLDPPGDQTADALYRHYKNPLLGRIIKNPMRAPLGSIVFYGTERKITHVGISIAYGHMVEAGKGGSKTRTREDAARVGARIMISQISRPVTRRVGIVAAIEPFGYPWQRR